MEQYTFTMAKQLKYRDMKLMCMTNEYPELSKFEVYNAAISKIGLVTIDNVKFYSSRYFTKELNFKLPENYSVVLPDNLRHKDELDDFFSWFKNLKNEDFKQIRTSQKESVFYNYKDSLTEGERISFWELYYLIIKI